MNEDFSFRDTDDPTPEGDSSANTTQQHHPHGGVPFPERNGCHVQDPLLEVAHQMQLLSKMLLDTGFIFSLLAVFPVQLLLLYQTQQLQFADVGDRVQISCISTDKIEDGGQSASWYKREGGRPLSVKTCADDDSASRFVCKADGQKLILQISRVQKEDSGLYFCAYVHGNGLSFSNGSTSLVVGDSYTPSSWVMLLQPAASPAPQSEQSDHLACVVHGVSGRVQLSWDVPGGLRQEGRTLLVKNSTGSLAFLSLLRVPPGAPRASGEPYACEVRFNSSGTSITRTMALPAALDQSCLKDSAAVVVVVAGALALLLLLSALWIRCCRSRPGPWHKAPEPPSSLQMTQENICYAQLDFASKSREGNKKRQASQGEHLNV